MADLSKIKEINKVIETYFEENASVTIVPVKKLMPAFVRAGVFVKDQKNGLPIRKILRELDEAEELHLIPMVHAERNESDTYWYFIPPHATAPATPYKRDEKQDAAKDVLIRHEQSDYTYVVDLCDMALGQKANRKMRFEFLHGDLHKDGVSKTKLPVDAFYESLHLVIGFRKGPGIQSEKNTESAIKRADQRRLYEKRRAEILPKHGLDFVTISYADFSCNSQNIIMRNQEADLEIVKTVLKKYLT